MTLTAALKPGNSRNSQAVGKAFMHSSFRAATPQHWFCPISEVTKRAPAENAVCWGVSGNKPPPPRAARLPDA